MLGSPEVLHLNAHHSSNGLTQVNLIVAGVPATSIHDLNLAFQLSTAGPDGFDLSSPTVQALPQVPAIAIVPSPAKPSA